jgi:antitoxin MazE
MQDGSGPKSVEKARIIRNGDHLGIELPQAMIDQLGLKEGDFLDVETSEGQLPLRISKVGADELFARVRAMRGLVPADYKFKRDDAYDAE